MKKVSVVVPCYNSADTIYRCWKSIKNQSIGIDNIECIFVNDYSEDNGKTIDILNDIASEDSYSVRIINSGEHRGPGGSRNLGISYATGKYLQFLDADDDLAVDALERLYNIAEENNTDIIQFNHTLILGDQKKINKVSKGNELFVIDNHDKRIDFLNATKVTYGCTNKFYRLELIKKTNASFAEHVVYEEPSFVYPLFLYTDRVYFCEEGFYQYHLHGNSIVTSKIGKHILDHPKVQLITLENCIKRKELYEEYKEVIACYFIWSFYCETLMFASEHKEAFLPIDYFHYMQEICMKLYPDWGNNSQLMRVDMNAKRILNSLHHEFADQRSLDDFINTLRNI